MILTVGCQNKNGAKSLRAKTWMIMKLTIVLLLFFTFQVSAKSYAQKITIVKKNVHLADIFKSVEMQTGFLFFYDKALIQKTDPIDVSVKDATLEQALNACLKDQQLTYSIVKNTVVIQAKKVSSFYNKLVSVVSEMPPVIIQIRGNIMDENGKPLSNASVTIKGTNKGVTTNANGNFSIDVPNAETILIISYTGYVSQEVLVGSRTTFNINLVQTDNPLNEVVVTALGIGRQSRSLGYSTTTVKAEDLTVNRTPNLMNALEGKVAGVNISGLGTGPAGTLKFASGVNPPFQDRTIH